MKRVRTSQIIVYSTASRCALKQTTLSCYTIQKSGKKDIEMCSMCSCNETQAVFGVHLGINVFICALSSGNYNSLCGDWLAFWSQL